MEALHKAIADGWSWKLGTPVAVLATSPLGNVIVKNGDGWFFRIMPEEWQCDLLAHSEEEFAARCLEANFRRDWEMRALVEKAQAAHGSLAEGQVYHLVIPGHLGGKYEVENLQIISLCELLAHSGAIAQQVDDVPDGGEVIITPME